MVKPRFYFKKNAQFKRGACKKNHIRTGIVSPWALISQNWPAKPALASCVTLNWYWNFGGAGLGLFSKVLNLLKH